MNRTKIIHITGPAGAGKSLLLIALYLFFFRRDRAKGRDGTGASGNQADYFELLEANRSLLRQVEKFLRGEEVQRTPPTETEFMRVRWYGLENGWRGQELLFVSYPGEQLRGLGMAAGDAGKETEEGAAAVPFELPRGVRRGNGPTDAPINPVELRRSLESDDAILAATMNAFCWQELGELGLLGLTAWWQEKCGFKLGPAVARSAELLWGLVPEAVAKLDAGYDELSAELLENAVVTYHPEESSRDALFTVAGVSELEGTRVLRVLRAVAAKVARLNEVDFITLTEVTAKVSRKVAIVTHASLLPFIRCLQREDFDPLFIALLGPNEDRLVSQEVLAPLLRVTLRNNAQRPIRKEDVLTVGAERFWMGVRRQILRPAAHEPTALSRAFPGGNATAIALLRRFAGAAASGCGLLGVLVVGLFYALFSGVVATLLTLGLGVAAALVLALFVLRVQDRAGAATPATAPSRPPVATTSPATMALDPPPAADAEASEEPALVGADASNGKPVNPARPPKRRGH